MTKKILAGTVPPLIAFAVQAIFWSVLSPFGWLLFYPAVVVSSWLGGRASGISAALISTAIAAYYFLPPERTMVVHARYLPGLGVFAVMSLAFVVFNDRFRRAQQEAEVATARLRESEEQFRLAIDDAPIGMALVALDGRFVRVNRAFCEIVGYTQDELYRLMFQDITHPDDLASDVALVGQLARGEIPRYQLEKRYIRKDGSIVTTMLSVSVLRASDGTPLHYIAQLEDITQRKRAEEALHASEREFRSLAESMPQIVWVTGADGLNIYFNQQWVDYTGLTVEEGSGEGWITPFHPDDRQRAWEAWRRATQYRETYSLECRLRRADGVYQWWLIRGVPVLGPDGEIQKWFGTCTDVEHIKRMEKEQALLAEAGAVLAGSLDYEQTLATLVRLVVRDFADWCIVQIVGEHDQIRRAKVVSRDPGNADLCADLERMSIDRGRSDLLRTVFETQQALVIEHVTPQQLESVARGPEHLQALRAMTPSSMMASPLLRHGQLFGVLAFVSCGSRHYVRSDLGLAEALADRAAVAIENARLYSASVEAAHIRDEVLRFVAHDLRNPLSAITMQASLLQRSGAEPERRSRKPAETIQRAATRMSRLIQDILDVSVMEEGHLSIEPARVPTEQLVADAVEAQRSLAASASIDLQLDLEISVSDVWVDRDRVLQVFENLIGNAVKFTPAGGRITAGAASHDGDVVFWVKDTGAGISAEEMPHVFDRFWQAGKTRRAGAGLGLQIVKGIVESHGGRIWVESEVRLGSTFYFTLPTAQTAGAQPTPSELH